MQKVYLLEKIKKLSCEFYQNVDMGKYTTFQSGGIAKYFCIPNNQKSLVKIVKMLATDKLKFYILGQGSNTLFKNFDGIVISTKKLDNIKIRQSKVFVECGVMLSKVHQKLLINHLSGLEFSVGIPASMGGAITMNAGAYGHEIGEKIDQVVVFDGKKIKKLRKNNIWFTYRNSIIKENKWILLSATLILNKSNQQLIQTKMLEIMDKRRQSQPLEYPSAGSVFKRNEQIIPAKIIDKLGLKGFNINDAEVSRKHAGFIINRNKATYKDIFAVVNHVQQTVFKHENILLEPEIEIIGD